MSDAHPGWGGKRPGAGRPPGPPAPPKVKAEPLPHVPVDLAMVERAASIGCTTAEIAALCDASVSKVFTDRQRYPEIDEAYDRGRAKGRATLRRWQWDEAGKGNATMLIWLGKQLLGQHDKHEVSGDPERPVYTIVVPAKLIDA